MAALFFLPAPSSAQETIVEIKNGERDYMLEGDIVTIWEDGFLFNDGTGELVVDMRPKNSFDLGLEGRMTIMVLGRLQSDDTFRPSMMVMPSGERLALSGADGLPPLDLTKVMLNTARYGIPRKVKTNSGLPAGMAREAGSAETNAGMSASSATAAAAAAVSNAAAQVAQPAEAAMDANSPEMQATKAEIMKIIEQGKKNAPKPPEN
jgi:hypothetical protein